METATIEWVNETFDALREVGAAMYTRIGDEVWVVHGGRLLFAGTVRVHRGRIHISEWLACYPGQADKDGNHFAREESGIRSLIYRCLWLANREEGC